MENKKICSKPFTKIEIDSYGDVYTCCPCYIKYNKIGNIWDKNVKTIEDIWNSKEAKEFRRKILNNDYSLCNLDICREISLEENKNFSDTPPLPEYVMLAYDKECNIQCITCRDKKIKNSLKQNFIHNKILSIMLPLLQNAKLITISGSGEAFYSRHSRLLIKKLTKTNKTTKFNIYTNGLLFNEANLKQLNLINRIENVCVSVHALEPELYKKIMVGSNLDVVLKNLNYISTLYRTGQIKSATINSVISNMNYTEIPKLIELAKKLDFYISFSIFTPFGSSLDKNYKELAIWEETHENYSKLKNILKTAREINYDKCIFPPAFKSI